MTIQGKVTDIFENAQLKLIDPEGDFVGSSWRFCRITFLKLQFDSESEGVAMKAVELWASNVRKITKIRGLYSVLQMSNLDESELL
jgi:hypothetical protein